MPAPVSVSVLGPVEVTTGDDTTPLMPMLRVLLAALTVDAPRAVPGDVLRSRLWDDDASEGTPTTLYSYVSRLRRRLGPAALATQAPGYRLDVPADAIDALRFTRLLRAGRQHHDPTLARPLVAEAIGLWRGEAYAGVHQQFARLEAARLGEQLLEAHELAAELDLRLGRPRDVVDQLTPLVDAEPLREGMRATLMTALYRCGRQAAALEVYQEGRHHLAEELGVDPSPALRRLHERVLRQDPSLDAPREEARTEAASGPAPEPDVVTPSSSTDGPARLTAPLTSLVGRDEHVAEVADLLLDGTRLLTMTGPGGVGKTRLALAVAEHVRADFPDGVALVPLATVHDPHLVMPTISHAVAAMLPEGDGDDGDDGPHRDLVGRLHGRRVLLVLDNLEHLLDAAVEVGWLVGACPGLVVLTTSRAPLRVTGEVEHLVEPLPVPEPSRSARLTPGQVARVGRSPAVSLFVARAQGVARGFGLNEHNAGAVAEICRRLGGIPLALELAATRVRLYGPDTLLARLDESLNAGPRDLPPRQRTMQATLEWSYRLLDEPAQQLFRSLAVFSGGWTFEMLQSVAGPEAVAALEVLVEHSLVSVAWSSDGRPRYSMLEPTQQHAVRLADPDELAASGRAHAAACVDLAERAIPGYLAAEQVHWLRLMDAEHANMLAAFDRCVTDGDHDTAARLSWALWAYWFFRGQSAVGRRVSALAVALPGTSPGPRCRALVGFAAMAYAQGDHAAAGDAWRVGLELGEQVGDLQAQGNSHAGLGIVALATGDLTTAMHHHRRAIALGERLGSETYGRWILTLNHVWLGTALLASGRQEEALVHLHLGRRLGDESGDRLAAFVALWNLARIEGVTDPDAAHRHLTDGIRLSFEVGYLSNLSYFIDALVVLEVRRDAPDPHRLDRWATLLGAAEACRNLGGGPGFGSYYLPDDGARDQAAATVADRLGGAAFDARRDEGRGLELGDVVLLALGAARHDVGS
ncbi:BTAD domain-containing putative transcriptional regulator [Nocardioides sp. C4-1]|uniref:AfsR/SARP family transcriptional regulator n=1 Tax=Nocardioides sp. C4-1 TaxID=3151851 RepID=UPI00326784E0